MTRVFRLAIVACGGTLLCAAPVCPQTPDSVLAGLTGRTVRFETREGAASGRRPETGELVRLDSDSLVVRFATRRFALPRRDLLSLAVRCEARNCWEAVASPRRM